MLALRLLLAILPLAPAMPDDAVPALVERWLPGAAALAWQGCFCAGASAGFALASMAWVALLVVAFVLAALRRPRS